MEKLSFLKSLADIEKLKNSKGSDIKVWGSGKFVQLLLKRDLVDELWLKFTRGLWVKGKSYLMMARIRQHLH